MAEYPVMAQKYGAGSAQNLRVGFGGQLAFQLEGRHGKIPKFVHSFRRYYIRAAHGAGERRGRHVRVALAGHHVVELLFCSFLGDLLRSSFGLPPRVVGGLGRCIGGGGFLRCSLRHNLLGLRRDGGP